MEISVLCRQVLKMWWPGTELNRRRQPFQGCALPPELPGHFSSAHPARVLSQIEAQPTWPGHWRSYGAGCREAQQLLRWDRAELLDYSNALPFSQNCCETPLPHTSPLAFLARRSAP